MSSDLPPELIDKIFDYVLPEDTILVCRLWRDITLEKHKAKRNLYEFIYEDIDTAEIYVRKARFNKKKHDIESKIQNFNARYAPIHVGLYKLKELVLFNSPGETIVYVFSMWLRQRVITISPETVKEYYHIAEIEKQLFRLYDKKIARDLYELITAITKAIDNRYSAVRLLSRD